MTFLTNGNAGINTRRHETFRLTETASKPAGGMGGVSDGTLNNINANFKSTSGW